MRSQVSSKKGCSASSALHAKDRLRSHADQIRAAIKGLGRKETELLAA
jgi:hypothetical protein